MAETSDLQAALAVARTWLGVIPGVHAVQPSGRGEQAVIEIHVTENTIPLRWIPKQLHGIPIRLVGAAGPVRAEN